MTTKRRTSRKSRMSEAQRAARRDTDAALIEAAADRLDGDEAGADLTDWIRTRPALARLSVRNIALLAEQADERGTDVTNVRTFSTWQNLYGRQVKQGAQAYKLIVPFRRDPEQGQEQEAPEQAPTVAEDDAKKAPRFYLKAKWFDIADTEPVEGFEPPAEGPEPVPATEDEAAAALFASLVDQAERAGYEVEEVLVNEAEAGVSVDPGAWTLAVRTPSPEAGAATAWTVLAEFTSVVAAMGGESRRERSEH